MVYRGEDLDLRTPQTWSSAPVELGSQLPGEALINGPRARQGLLGYARGGPIWVDDVVLDCCNHAFDVALAHRAAEVSVEHLVHAMTRIEAAAEVLEVRGIRIAALRRETAMLIASEVPVGLPNGKGAPRRSDEMEHVLRLAAARAYRRNAPAGVDDLLHVLMEGAPEAQGPSRLRPAFQVIRNAFGPEAPDLARERAAPFFQPEPQRSRDAGPSATDNIQNARLDALEEMIRTLSSELQNERKSLGGVLQDLQREIMAQRSDTTRTTGSSMQDKTQAIFSERLQNLEHALLSGGRPMVSPSVDLSLLSERINAAESALKDEIADVRGVVEELAARLQPALDLSPLLHRLDVIEEAVLSRELPERVKAVEVGLATDRVRVSEAHSALVGEVRAVASAAEQHKSEIPVAVLAVLRERLDATQAGLDRITATLASLNETLSESARSGEEAQAAYAREMAQVGEALTKLNANQIAIAASMDAMRQESDQAVQAITAQIVALERASAVPVGMLEQLSATVEKMNRLTVERYYRRNRFWYWLFGTDDWVAASWPSQSARIAEELRAVKPVLKR